MIGTRRAIQYPPPEPRVKRVTQNDHPPLPPPARSKLLLTRNILV
jgi:hypothetical protein